MSIQAQILALLEQLKAELGLTYIFISHDLAVVHHVSDRVAVMYLGKLVELAGRDELYANPLHPYTQGLMGSVPGMHVDERQTRLEAIPGAVPSLFSLPHGCKFNDRCKHAFDRCFAEEPRLREAKPGQHVRCWLYEEA